MNFVAYRIVEEDGYVLDFELTEERSRNRIDRLNAEGGNFHLEVGVEGEEQECDEISN